MPAAPTSFGSSARRLVGLATVVLVVGVLWVAQAVVMPLALGMVLAFVLTPIVKLFERIRFPRALAVAGTLAFALGLLGSVAWMGAQQIGDLAGDAPRYISTIHDKLTTDAPTNRTLERIDRTMERLSAELDEETEERERARPVRVVSERFSALDSVRQSVELVLAPAATFVMVLVLVAFMLGRREDVRDRVIRMVGPDNVTVTTRLIDETFQGVSRYLLTQSLLNAAVGALVAAGMWLLGVPYPALFGFAMALLRFVPYLGALSVTALACIIAFASTPGWYATLGTFALCVALDAAFAYIVEPVVMARRVGVSSLALLISAVFWTWIWGAVGLAVATPLTLCLAALGRHMPGFELLDVVLGDTRPLSTDVSYYQRLLARDADEAREIVTRERSELGDVRLVDEVVMPALLAAGRDQDACTISDDDAAFAESTTAAILGGLDPDEDTRAAVFDVVAVGHGAAALDAMLRLASGGGAR
ncbi:MAG TPA: AI-2E family transporter, partial [Nannocystaceae bacterium]|nr:AI-2E family transporter [Nannocystaceae bacterium]